jgi:catechol 2,3-dioxygenase-like lactoylglutathione lyase family enzyme
MSTDKVRAILFVKDLQKLTSFYVGALGMRRTSGDTDHSVLACNGFELIVHQIPKAIADEIVIEQPPERRIWGAIRLDYPVSNIRLSRKQAQSLGGGIDDAPPDWADRDSNFFFGYDPEGNQFGVNGSVTG